MSDLFRVFGTQFDPSVVQGLMRQQRQRQMSERNRTKSSATTPRRKSGVKRRGQPARVPGDN